MKKAVRMPLLAALLLLPLAALFVYIHASRNLHFISDKSAIIYPIEARAFTISSLNIGGGFRREFSVDRAETATSFEMHTLGRVESVTVNGSSAPFTSADADTQRQRVTADLSGLVHAGSNTITILMDASLSLPILAAKSSGLIPPLSTDTDWQAQIAGQPMKQAVFARTPNLPDQSVPPFPPKPLKEFMRHLPLFLLAAGAGIALGLYSEKKKFINMRLFWMLAGLAGIVFLLRKVMPSGTIGYDASGHSDYILYMLQHGTLPDPAKTWSGYHPPLFYALDALITALLHGLFSLDYARAMKVLPWLSAAGTVWVSAKLGKEFFGADSRRAVFWTAFFALLLPMNLYISAYVTNEPFFAFVSGVAIWLAARAINKGVSSKRAAWAGLFAGLALLSKYTFVIAIPVITAALFAQLVLNEKAGWLKTARRMGIFLGTAGLVAGWFYIRNIMLFGSLFADHRKIFAYWQMPGFKTPEYFTSFGTALQYPFFTAGFRSFWDGAYASLWGDAQAAGATSWELLPQIWDAGFMSSLYIIGLPVTALMVIGFLLAGDRILAQKLSPRTVVQGMCAALLYTGLLFFILLTVQHPSYSTAKAFYLLFLTGPLCAVTAGAALKLADGPVWSRSALYAIAAMLACAAAAAFII